MSHTTENQHSNNLRITNSLRNQHNSVLAHRYDKTGKEIYNQTSTDRRDEMFLFKLIVALSPFQLIT